MDRDTEIIIDRFNSRTRVGCDCRCTGTVTMTLSFNSRTRVGCDTVRIGFLSGVGVFQFTHPRRVRPMATITSPAADAVSIHAPA